MFWCVGNERCGEVEWEKDECGRVKPRSVSPLGTGEGRTGEGLSQGKEGGYTWAALGLGKLRVCLIFFIVCGACSESTWSEGSVLSCRKTGTGTAQWG